MARGRGFGLKSGSNTRFRGGGGGRGRGRGGGRGGGKSGDSNAPRREDDGTQLAEKFERIKLNDEIDEKLGFGLVQEGPAREGWLVNMHPTTVKDPDWPGGRAAVDYYFIQDDGSMFKATYMYDPYFCIACKVGMESTIEEWLHKKYEGVILRIIRDRKEDLKLPNHLMGHRRLYLKLCFRNITDLLTVRRDLMPLALANSAKRDAVDAYAEVVNATSGSAGIDISIDEESGWLGGGGSNRAIGSKEDPRDGIIDIREYDVPYYLRVAIDNEIRVGLWYAVTFTEGQPSFKHLTERVKRADPVVMAFDIETTKAPLKFPDQAIDQVMMISYMVDGQGYLITNREIVSEDIEDFEYTPKEGYEGPFIIFNEPDEAATIKRFFSHIQEVKPAVMATFNGDFFDFPFLDARAKANGINMFFETGFAKDAEDEYKCRTCVHMDCFRWVKRDSYLPQGSQGLKAVTTAKLGYNPIELDPELMTPYAMEQPQVLAQYSVSDAVATYYLYMKYVHPFIFSLCNIIPLNPDEVLRKGSGTLCETLLMVEAYRAHIIMPNKHAEEHGNFYDGHLLASETYVGGHVEALEAGVFRSDIPTDFKITPSAVQKLIDDLDAALTFCIVEESKASIDDVTNYDEVKDEIQAALEILRDNPKRTDNPLIYHLDVAAMYPNIMLSNRLQPDSMVDESVCAVCDYNRPGKTCDRRLEWAWRGEFFPAHRDEYNMIRHALNQETFPAKRPGGPQRRYADLTPAEQTALLHKRLGDYSRKVYKKTKDTKVERRESIVCQRENPFYVDTVRRFRDRRYEYKGLHKTWKKNLDNVVSEGRSIAEVDEAKKMIVLYDSLQLAHKCILNSFYGYVMRKGARWHSMEMAGITCLTGATIIQMARALVEQIGRPLELDTDGIWCMLPGVFPENFKFKLSNGKAIGFSYPCTMLNHLVHAQFTNHQYHDLDPETGLYKVHSENSIFFELDGPYKAMILPSSKEEDKLLKKRYAVFNDDGSLAELKGFEVKRRGELQLIKIFQSQLFEKFLLGTTTEECYAAVAEVADQWLDILFSKAVDLEDEELVELIAENRSMSKTLAEYGSQKSTSISTARRLAEFLGDQMVKDKGLACKFIISARPAGAPVTERAIPVAIFSAEESVKRTYLRKWLKDNSLVDFDLRSILDWQYYIERLGSVIQKLITIPAAMQKVSNPVPRIHHPDWLHRRVANQVDKFKQNKLTDFFKPAGEQDSSQERPIRDIEDIEGDSQPGRLHLAPTERKFIRQVTPEPEEDDVLKKPVPNPYINYSAWIKAMRPRWKLRREGTSATSSAVVPSMFNNVKVRTNRNWDVVQLRPSNTPGRYMLWLSVDGELAPVPLRIPREFYVHMRTPNENIFRAGSYSFERVTRNLPRDLPCANLYKVTVREDTYQEIREHFIDLASDPNVDGVFELQVPLVVRALLKFGRTCESRDIGMSLNRAQTVGLDLHQLDSPLSSTSRPKYLNGGKGGNYIFLYHACSANAPLHVFALFYPTGAVKLHIVDPATRRQPIARLAETYVDLRQKRLQNYGKSRSLAYPESREFNTTYHSTDLTALKAISRELGLHENKSYTVVLSSSKDDDYFIHHLPKLVNFPVLSMSKAKSAHTLDVFPWQSHVAQKMLDRYLSLASWLDRLVVLADYYDIPIGHIEGDQPLFTADVTFARRLVQQDIVLWWSPSDKPDLGGIENDKRPTDELPNTEFLVSGIYPNVCLELTVRNLAVNSVIHSVVVNELEGSGGTTAFDSVSKTLDEYAEGTGSRDLTLGESNVSSHTFSILKNMVRGWLLDRISSNETSPATLSIDHFWRWISSSASNMYDSSIHRFVHGLMRKTFVQLLAEFKRLGSHVVYADFSRILLGTSKPPGTAHAYATYINTAVTSHELFQHIYLRTERFYDYLVFMDQANMGGIVCEDPLALEPPNELSIEMHWNIAEFLPVAIQKQFQVMAQYFIVELFLIRQKANEVTRVPLRAIENGSVAPDATQRDPNRKNEMERIQEFITRKLTRRMLKTIGGIQERYRNAHTHPAETMEEWEFPVLPGSHLHLSDPPLEFVKFTCAVFDLAKKEYGVEVGLLKRNALDLVGMKEFANEAVFRNPCEPLKLSNVPCKHCDALRDFDFCRDPELAAVSDGGGRGRWHCTNCWGEYDRVAIEMTLIGMVFSLERAFAQQDLRCAKCQQIRSDNVSRWCTSCSGSYQLTMSKVEVRRKLRTIVNVAIVHGLGRLKECAQLMLEGW
ncbi:dna polymerase catalytic subunit a [Moniliophthora roreri]|nr:dna polymerase catalytic subunit a [Moniliophthora roreri]